MEQIGNKGEKALADLNIETQSDARLKKKFRSSLKVANAGVIAWCVLVSGSIFSLTLGWLMGLQGMLFTGAIFLCLAVVGIILAFLAQSANQIVRFIAKFRKKGKDFFKEEEKDCTLSKTAAECYGFVKRILSRNKNEAKGSYSRYEAKCSYNRNQHVRNNARSYRCASRPAFAYSSSSDDGGGDSGDSDSGDPPGPLYHTALKLSKTFYRKPNSLPCPWRFSFVPGCWRLPRCRSAARRWAV